MTSHLKITAWSYSRLAQYETCPLQFAGKNIYKWPTAGSPAMARGDVIHKGVAKYVTGEESTLPRDAMAHRQMVDFINEVRQLPAEAKQVEQQWGFSATWKPTGWFDRAGQPATWFRSILDAGVMYDDDTYEALDWKTGRKYGSNMEQMETQAIAAFNKFPHIKHFTARLVYLDQNEFEIEEFPKTHQAKLQDKWAKRVAPMFQDTVFAPRPNDKCRFCDFSKNKGGQCAFG